MAYRIISPRNSFIQFGESSTESSANFKDIQLCLPVLLDDDVYFQFVIESDTPEESQVLCDLDEQQISVGIALLCTGPAARTFPNQPERYRLSERQVLLNWAHGLPNFGTYIKIGECFFIRVDLINIPQTFCSNCLQRIASDEHTSVLEYSNDEDAFGFSYCNSAPIDSEDTPCEPMFITFSNVSTLTVPYTAQMREDYGEVPTIKAWIYDTNGDLVNMSFRQALDQIPPTKITFDFGGNASGIVKIS